MIRHPNELCCREGHPGKSGTEFLPEYICYHRYPFNEAIFSFAVTTGFVNFAPSDKIDGQHHIQRHLQEASLLHEA